MLNFIFMKYQGVKILEIIWCKRKNIDALT